MESDEDIFVIDDETDEVTSPVQPAPVNPVEEYLLKQHADVQSKIDAVVSEIAETDATIVRVLNTLEWRALHGEDAMNSDSDNESYTAEGAPVVKKHKHGDRINGREEKILELISQWQCILQDKWIIGVELINRSCCTLLNPKYYPCVLPTRDDEIFGEWTFWKLKDEHSFYSERVSSIHPGAVVATVVLDLPTFDQESIVKCWGIISYEINETQYQIPVPSIQLSAGETIDSSCIKFLDECKYDTILALKSTSTIEKIVNVQFARDDDRDDDQNEQNDQNTQNGFGNELFRFLIANIFTGIRGNVFLMKEHGSLMYCLIEIQSIDSDEANITIFARSVSQLNIMLDLLKTKFPSVSIVEETDHCVEAAMALIRELEMIRDNKSIQEIQEAKAITDLLIP